MHTFARPTLWTTILASLVFALPLPGQTPDVPPYNRADVPGDPPAVPGSPPTAGAEVQGRGPIHEGFAQPGNGGVGQPGPVVAKRPPEPITELPPDQKPQGDNVAWIPGYWAWDADRSDFLWVSGFWRVMPAGRRWVAGYWSQTDDGWRWVSGLGASSGQAEITYPARSSPPAHRSSAPATRGSSHSSGHSSGHRH